MVAYRYSIVLLLAVVTSTVTSQTTGNEDYCASEILRISNAGKITATTSDPLAIGESVSITCSTDCAYYWHTVLIDGEAILSNTAIQTIEDYQLSVTNTILNCPDCTQPEDVNCSDGDSQEGPIQSVLNFTLLSPGDHYVQCIAHMYHPDSDLWPDNRIISIPSRTIKIKGPPIHQDDKSSSTSSAISSLSTASIIPTSSVSITLNEVSPTLITNSRQHSSHVRSTSSKLPPITDALPSLSPLLSTPSATVLTSTRRILINSISTGAGVIKTTKSTVLLKTDGHRPVDATTLPSPMQTFIAQADPMNQASSGCNPLNMDNTTVYVVFSVLVSICVLLIVVVIALIVANRKGVAQYNHLSLSIQGNSTNRYPPNSSNNDIKELPISSSPDLTLSPDLQSSPV